MCTCNLHNHFGAMSVNYQDITNAFKEHFFENATKTESIEPFYADNVEGTIEELSVNGKKEVLDAIAPYLPLALDKLTVAAGQPFLEKKVLFSSYASSKDKKVLLTFVIEEIDVATHRYAITKQLLKIAP